MTIMAIVCKACSQPISSNSDLTFRANKIFGPQPHHNECALQKGGKTLRVEQLGKAIAFNLVISALCLFTSAAWIVDYSGHHYATKKLVVGILFLLAGLVNGALGIRLTIYRAESAQLGG